MTTIATDGKSMAGDGLATRRDMITCETAIKVHRLADGSLFGGAGDKPELAALRAWIDGGEKGPRPKAKDMVALVLKPSGELWYYTESAGAPTEVPNAVGSGEELAIGAMEAGASPEEAVAIAARRNTATGGKITVLELNQKSKLEAA